MPITNTFLFLRVSFAIFSFIVIAFLLHTLRPFNQKALLAFTGAFISSLAICYILEKDDPDIHSSSDLACNLAPTIITAAAAHTKYVSLPIIHVDDSI